MSIIISSRKAGISSHRRHSAASILRASGAIIALLAAAPLTVLAQAVPADTQVADAATDVPEIIVTAERRAQSLQRTPVSVGVLGGDQLGEQGLTFLRDLGGSVAGLQTPAMFSPSMSYLYIRGIGTASPTYSGAVGIYIDDVYQARTINSGAFSLPDVAQVEVLRGPQGTLYGQNTSAGAIKVVTRTPGNETEGNISLSVGNYGQFDARGYVAGPLIDDVLTASFAFAHEETDGYTKNLTLDKKVNAIDTNQGRLKLHYTAPGDSGLVADLSVYYLRDRSDNNSYSPLNVANPDPRVTYEDLDLAIHNNAFLVGLNLSKPLNDQLTLKSITGWRGFDNDPQPWSLDGLASSLFSWDLNIKQRQVSQEFQLLGDYGDLSLTGGALVYHETFDVNRPSVTLGTYAGSRSETETTNIGFYTQGRYAFTERLGATLGLRYYAQWDKFNNVGYTSNAAYQELTTRYSLTGLKQNTDGFTPKIGVDYQFDDGLFGYASVTRGQKSGGYNPVASNATIAAVPVDPEKVTAYEAGLKFNTPGNRFIVNLAGFYNDFKNYQTALSNVYVNGVLINGSVTVNAAKSRTYGVEAEATLRPLDQVELGLAATALDASFRDFTYQQTTGAVTYDGNWLPYTSRYNLSGNLTFTQPFENHGEVRLRGEVKYQSHSFTDIQNNVRVPSQVYVNAEAQYRTEDGDYTGFIRVKNIFDKTYATAGIPLTPTIPGVQATFYNPPRMFQIGVTHTF